MVTRRVRTNWLVRGVASGIAGIVFSITLSALIAVLIWAGVDWIEALERRGTDLTMRTMVAFSSPVVDQLPAEQRDRISPIVFLDVDEEGCQRLARRPDDCRTRGIGQPDVLITLGEALRRSNAQLIVLDVRWPQIEAFDPLFSQARMIQAWGGQGGPPVVAVLPGALSSAQGIVVDWEIVDAASSPRLRFAASAVWTGAANQEMVVRAIPDVIPVVGTADGRRPQHFATVPGAAVEALEGRPQAGASPSGSRQILFTLPALSASEDEPLASIHLGNWERRALSNLVEPARAGCADCRPAVRTEGLAGQIVIVGSSAPAAQDLHMTPLGVMAGAEILANAIRARQLIPVVAAQGGASLFWSKVVGTLPGMVIAMLASIAIARVKRRRRRTARGRLGQTSLIVFLFLVALAASLFLCFQLALGGAIEAARAGQQTDLLLPTLALFVEGFVTFSKWLIDTVEKNIVRVINHLRASAGQR